MSFVYKTAAIHVCLVYIWTIWEHTLFVLHHWMNITRCRLNKNIIFPNLMGDENYETL